MLVGRWLPFDFEDSGAPNSSSFSKKMDHPWLQIAPPISQGFLPFGLRAIWIQTAVEIASKSVRTTTMIKQL